ncbi:MAG: tyrosinase family protein [Gammaproteobacteria bacterium]
MYWANSHGTPNSVPVPPALRNVWRQCHHGTDHFLSWHRAYVFFFFESLIREITQTDTFALPYWQWYGSPPPNSSSSSSYSSCVCPANRWRPSKRLISPATSLYADTPSPRRLATGFV